MRILKEPLINLQNISRKDASNLWFAARSTQRKPGSLVFLRVLAPLRLCEIKLGINTMRILGMIFLLALLVSCQTITRKRTDLNIPASTVIFSFDDGPNGQSNTTARLLDILKKYHIQAFFCLLGENAEHNPELVRRIHDEGHYFINHGYSDKLAGKMGDDEFRDNLAKGEAAISAALGRGLYPKLYRPHGGFYNSKQEKIFREAGYTLVPANIRIYDAVMTGSEQAKAVRRIIKKIEQRGGGIVLLHDAKGSHSRMEKELQKNPQGTFNRSWISDVMEEIIPILLERGFILNSPDGLWDLTGIDKKPPI